MKTRSLFVLLFILAAALLQPALGDFLTFHGDPQRTGSVSDSGPVAPDLLWSEKVTAKGYIGGGAAVSDGRLYVSSWPDMSYKGEQGIGSFDAVNGSLLWLNPIGGKGGASTPALKDGRIYVGSFYGDLYCIDALTGETIWNRTLETEPQWWGVASSPLAVDVGILATTFSQGTLHLLDYEGEEVWNLSTSKIDPYTSPAYSEGKVYFAGGDPALYCVDVSSGLPLWILPTDAPITSTPSVAEGSTFFATRNHLLAVDAAAGDVLWRESMTGTISSPAVSGGWVYVGTDDSTLDCRDALDGDLIWRAKVDSSIKSSPLVAGDAVYFGSYQGIVYALDALDGSEIWSYPTEEYLMASPSISDGVLFIGADDGRLYAFGPERSKVLWKSNVSIPDDDFDLTMMSGNLRDVRWETALGALFKAADEGGFDVQVNDSFLESYGLNVESIGGHRSEDGRIWRYWVNYPEESAPVVGPDRFDLVDGDMVTFYLGGRGASPDDSLRVEVVVEI